MSNYPPEVLWEYALGTLAESERAGLEAEASRSPALRAELAEICELAGSLPLALPETKPSPALKERLLRSIQAARPFDVWLEKFARLIDVGLEAARELMGLAY